MKKILVVEDEIKISKLIKKVLSNEGYFVELAHDGKEGLIMAGSGKYDLILLDIMLPKLNGLEVCKQLRYDGVHSPIIMLTAKDTIEDRMEATDAGANEYVAKPFSFEDLLLKIQSLQVSDENVLEDNKIKEQLDLYHLYQKIMDNIPVSIITMDKDGNMTSANKYYRSLSKNPFTLNNNVFVGNFFKRENLVDDFRKLLGDGTMVKRDHCYERNANGEDKYLKIRAVPLLDKEGNIDGALSMALDDTESVQLNKKLQILNKELEDKVELRTKQLNHANKELAKAMELKSMFIADVSHEMRTSLAIIQGNIELLSRDLIEEVDLKESYEHIFSEISRMTTMLTDMNLLSESETSKQRLDITDVKINDLISNVCNEVKVLAREKKVSINHKKSKSSIAIKADVVQIEKMILNLIRNAIRYNKENGSVDIWVEKSKDKILIHVKDTGIGISSEYINDIFERFYRIDKARSRNEGGSGLGLAICKWVAEIHGGNISVVSELDKGATFTVALPIN